MKRLWSYMKHYKKESILGPLFKLLEASFELLVPLVVANIIDTGIANRDGSYVLKMGGVLILLGFVGLASSITAQYFAAKAAVGTSTAMRKALFEHLNSFSYKELDTIGTSTLITRITSDINQVQTGVNLVLRLFLRSPFIVFGAMIMAFTIDVRCATIFAAVIPVLFVVVFAIMGVTIPWYRRVQNELDRVLLHVRENLSGVRVVRAFNRQQEEMKTFHRDSTALMNTQLFVGRISGLLNPLTYAIINVAVILLVWTGGRQVDAGILSQGQVVALVNYMSQILVELIKLANLIINVTKSLACLSRINKILDQETGMAEGTVREQKQENGVPCGPVPCELPGLSRRDHRYYRWHRFRKIHPGEPDSPFLRRDRGRSAGGRPERTGIYLRGPARKDRRRSPEGGTVLRYDPGEPPVGKRGCHRRRTVRSS